MNRETNLYGFSRFQHGKTPAYIDAICDAFQDACRDSQCDPLILIPMFILDFLCIHPFNDGNGRMSRLLTLLLLYRAGYIVGMYISIEKLIEQTKETYYETCRRVLITGMKRKMMMHHLSGICWE